MRNAGTMQGTKPRQNNAGSASATFTVVGGRVGDTSAARQTVT
jgi:hypothetical protein